MDCELLTVTISTLAQVWSRPDSSPEGATSNDKAVAIVQEHSIQRVLPLIQLVSLVEMQCWGFSKVEIQDSHRTLRNPDRATPEILHSN